jgi:hypothetical protein
MGRVDVVRSIQVGEFERKILDGRLGQLGSSYNTREIVPRALVLGRLVNSFLGVPDGQSVRLMTSQFGFWVAYSISRFATSSLGLPLRPPTTR